MYRPGNKARRAGLQQKRNSHDDKSRDEDMMTEDAIDDSDVIDLVCVYCSSDHVDTIRRKPEITCKKDLSTTKECFKTFVNDFTDSILRQ